MVVNVPAIPRGPHGPTNPHGTTKESGLDLKNLRWAVATHLDKYRGSIVLAWVKQLRVRLQLPTSSNVPDPATMPLRHKELDFLFRQLIRAVREQDFENLAATAAASHHEILDESAGLLPLLTKLSILADIVRRSIIADPTVRTAPALYYIDKVLAKLTTETLVLFSQRRTRGLKRLTTQYEQLKDATTSVLDSAPIGMLCTDRDGVITYFNNAQELISGKRREEALGKKLYVEYASRNAGELQGSFQRAITHGETTYFKRRRYEGELGIQYFDVTIGPIKDSHGRITGSVEILRDVTDNATLAQKSSEQNRELQSKVKELEEAYTYIGKVNRQFASLIDINATMSSKTSLDKILDFIVRSAAMMTKARLVTLRRLKNENMILMAEYGFDQQQQNHFKSIPVQKSVIGRVIIENRQILIVDLDDPKADFFLPDLKDRLKLKSLVSVPLRSRGRITGVLSIHLPEKREFSNLEINFLIALANQAALAIDVERALAPIRQNRGHGQHTEPPMDLPSPASPAYIPGNLANRTQLDGQQQ